MRDAGYASKARPVVIVQNDDVADFDSVILCLLTSCASYDLPTRVCVEPSPANGLEKTSFIMTDKIVTVDRSLLGKCIGVLDEEMMQQVTQRLSLVLDL